MLALNGVLEGLREGAVFTTAIVAGLLALAALGRLRPVRWVLRTLIADPIGRFFREEVEAIVIPLHEANVEALRLHTDEEMRVVRDLTRSVDKVGTIAAEARDCALANGRRLDRIEGANA